MQLAYAIGVAEPVSVFIETYGSAHVEGGDGFIASRVRELFDLRPSAIVRRFGLRNPIFSPTAAYGHVGRKPYKAVVKVQGQEKEVQFFGWELLDMVDDLKKAFGL